MINSFLNFIRNYNSFLLTIKFIKSKLYEKLID